MDFKLEQRANIKFCVQLRTSATETLEMLQQAYVNKAISGVGGRQAKLLEDEERSG